MYPDQTAYLHASKTKADYFLRTKRLWGGGGGGGWVRIKRVKVNFKFRYADGNMFADN